MANSLNKNGLVADKVEVQKSGVFMLYVLCLSLFLPMLSSAELTDSSLRDRLRVPATTSQDSRGLSWTPRDARLRDVYIKLVRSNTINSTALRNAFEYYESHNCSTARSQSCCQNLDPNTIAIADYTKPATENRLSLINLRTGTSLNMKVSHGQNSGNVGGPATQFGNIPESHQTPAGFLLARGTYMGSNGLSMDLHGLEERNCNSFSRRIVVHGASYVANGGRSFGCLAVEPSNIRTVTNLLQNSALVYNFNGETRVANQPNPRTCSRNSEFAAN